MVANPANEIYRASAGAVGCATHRFVKSREPSAPKASRSSGDSSGDIRVIRKFDGWRIQLHKDGSLVRLYTKSGYDCTTRFEALTSAVAAVPARSCIIDGEVTAFDPLGLLDFHALHFRTAADED